MQLFHGFRLDNLKEELVKHTKFTVRKVESIAAAKQLAIEITLWLTTHAQATRFVRVAELRALQKVGTEYINKLRNIPSYAEGQNITEIRLNLSVRIEEIQKSIKEVASRASKLWESKICTIDDAENLQNEVDELFSIYEGCKEDIDDFQIMRRALRLYIQAYKQLNNDQLNSNEFDLLSEKLKSDLSDSFGEEGPPWNHLDTIENFKNIILNNRHANSLEWIQKIETDSENLESLSAAEINNLHTRANNPPAFFSHEHYVRLEKCIEKIENTLNNIKIEWLMEKFYELTPQMKKVFLSRISS
jgi:hypothetical protein